MYVNDLNTKNYDNMQVLSAIIMYAITKYSGHFQEVSAQVCTMTSRRHLVHSRIKNADNNDSMRINSTKIVDVAFLVT